MGIIKVYGPLLVAVILAVVQAVFVASHIRSEKKKRRAIGARTLEPSDWFNESAWDDVACAIGSASILYGMCFVGFTNVAWGLLLPTLLLGGLTTVYHTINGSLHPRRLIK